MAPYQIHKYQENYRKWVVGLFSKVMTEHLPTTFHNILKLPRTLVLLLAGALALFLVSRSWVLDFVASPALLVALRFLAEHPWIQFEVMSLHTDMSDITKSYFSESGSCFWVVESGGQVVGMVGVLPIQKATLWNEQLQLLHLRVALEHRGQVISKSPGQDCLSLCGTRATAPAHCSTLPWPFTSASASGRWASFSSPQAIG
ncbi:LOW QUALITY PROTEIN: putative N-acetyltransferase 8B [Globicephala melas]|uniref:LOW QUALITY PROTEIN: putative N-acetyltransferase 8B n=1 Tax=Globicephala melas TaxID=9731 RepID=UPI00122F7737|nr:LOW QUALITY PROTEIN: putative N-acetyltransferase 8B [Globicephala melas]